MDKQQVQALDREQVKNLKALMETETWKLCQVLWARHSIRKEEEKAQALRVNNLDSAIYLQGYLDGMRSKDTLLKKAVVGKEEDSNPVY